MRNKPMDRGTDEESEGFLALARWGVGTTARHMWVAVLLAGCAASPSGSETDAAHPQSRDEPICSAEALAAFDPRSPVRERKALPPMQQLLGAQTVYRASVRCEGKESDAACIKRARRQVAERYPAPAELASELVREPNAIHAELSVDGIPQPTVTLTSAAQLKARVAELSANGRQVVVLSVEPFATEDAPRAITVRASSPATEDRQRALRHRLTLEPPDNEVAAMLRVQEQARRAAFVIQSFAPHADGSLVVELTCRTSAR